MKRKGFSVTELLVSVGLIGLMAGILLPVVGKARESARRVQCASNLRQIGTGMEMYEQTYKKLPADEAGSAIGSHRDGQFTPYGMGWLYETGCLPNLRVFFCPSATRSDPDGEYGVQNWGKDNAPSVATSYLWRLYPIRNDETRGGNRAPPYRKEQQSRAMDNIHKLWDKLHDWQFVNALYRDGSVRGIPSSESELRANQGIDEMFEWADKK
ncbi:MAG TPA: DUF1559 domain-containing protein [Candidatus Nanoarchaeia archaeon]|nr:DUF1559 domain-containing protein [Candidatus Nanoarchaeia archaeon]